MKKGFVFLAMSLVVLSSCFNNTQKKIQELSSKADLAYSKNNFIKAGKLYKEILSLDNKNIDALLGIGNIYFVNEHILQAKKYYSIARNIAPNSVMPLYNLAAVLKREQKYDESKKIYELLVKNFPDQDDFKTNLSILNLITGNIKDGFALNRKNASLSRDTGKKTKSYKEWDGTENVSGKTVLILTEQGLGETFFYIRYAKMLKKMGAKVFVMAHKPLVKLLSVCPYIDFVDAYGSEWPEFDCFVGTKKMPCAFGTTLETIPNKLPYLYGDEKLIKKWGKILSKDKNFKVGLSWKGNQSSEVVTKPNLKAVYSQRSVGLENISKLFDLDGISFYSLQKEYQDSKKAVAGIKVFGEDFDNASGPFMDTVAIMKNLDLFITIDTSLANLAGGLGIPVWVMLPYDADWRWLAKRTDSPWFPTARLFRQKSTGDWQSVIDEVKDALEKLIAKK